MSIINSVEEYIESSGNGKWCEDKVIIGKSIVGVLDGATPIDIIEIGNNPTQACWFVNSIAASFSSQKTEDVKSMDCFFTDIIGQIDHSKMRGIQSYNHPCCTAAFVWQDNSRIVFSVLGDCHIYVLLYNNTIMHVYDNRVDDFSGKTVLVSKQNHINVDEKNAAIRKQKITNREYLNRENGFFALTLNNSWQGSFVENRTKISDVKKILLCTDGFARLFIEYNIIDPFEFLNNGKTLLDGLVLIRNHEKSNSLNNQCVKNQDDASAVLLKITKEE